MGDTDDENIRNGSEELRDSFNRLYDTLDEIMERNRELNSQIVLDFEEHIPEETDSIPLLELPSEDFVTDRDIETEIQLELEFELATKGISKDSLVVEQPAPTVEQSLDLK